MNKMDIPASNHHVGSTERVFIAHVNDLNDFYLHSELVRDSLVKLGQDLYNEYSESLTKSSEIKETPNVGDYCACPSESEDWYRGIIRQLDSNGFAVVFKVDYGDIQCISIDFLRPLRERFFKLQRLAFHCSLVNLIKPINGWPLEVIREFHSRLTTTFLYAQFINYNEARDISEVEITEKSTKTPLNKDFEPYQADRSPLQINDKLVYRRIPMEMLDINQPNQIRILYYISPSRFYVYLQEKLNAHTSFQIELQKAMQSFRPVSTPMQYQPVAAQDNHAIWHRAVILDMSSDSSRVCVYFIDIGQKEFIPINNIRLLPEEFQRKPAFAIPCRLYAACPFNGNEQSIWKSNDQVHDELNRLMVNNVTCQVRAKQEQICYDVEIDIPKAGDLGTFLFGKNLISRPTMQNSQRSSFSSGQPTQQQQSFTRPQLPSTGIPPSRQPYQRPTQPNEYFNNSNNMTQQQQQPPQSRVVNTGPQNVTAQQSSGSSSTISTVPPQDGFYTIMQVHSTAEFYGLSQLRERELEGLSKYLEEYYNSAVNDQSLSVTFFMEGTPCVVQQNDKYHRVTIKHRESETRVLVKLVDRGDEIIVDTSELLQIDGKSITVPAFAQPFRLRGYDEPQSSASITRSLKKLILNQRVQITLQGSIINGFYPVEVTLNGNQSVNQMLANDKNLSVTSPISNNRPTFNQQQHTPIESQIFSNSTRHHSTVNQDSSGRSTMGHRTNDVLPPPQKILTGGTRTQPGRFGAANQTGPVPPSTNEQTPRFANPAHRNPQQQSQTIDSTSSNSGWNKDQNNKSNFSGGGAAGNQPSFGRQQSGPSQFGNNQRSEDFKITVSDNQQRTFTSGFPNDDRNEKQMTGNNFQQNNDGKNESGFRRGGSFSNRGGGFPERGGRGSFNDRNMNRNNDDNNNENNPQSSGGFARRGGGEGFGDRGNRGRNFQDRNGANRNQGDDYSDNNTQRSQNFNNNRGGFQNRRDQGEGGDFPRRGGGRGGPRGGGYSDRGRGGQTSFRDRGDSGIKLSLDNNNSLKSTASWSNTRAPTTVNFESGDRFVENEIPKETFKFVIGHIESANDFFIQLLSKGGELEKLSETLQNEYTQSPEGNLNLFKIHQPCLAKSSDKCWYRAIVLSTGLTKLKVRFIDFGDTTDVESKTIRQLAKKYCSAAPYAYQCTFKNVEAVENVNIESIAPKCAGKEFNGKMITKDPNGKFILESDDFLKLLLETNAIKLKSEVTLKRTKCHIAHIELQQHRFYIHEDKETVDKIAELVENEDPNTPTLSLDEVKQLEPNTMVIAAFEDAPYRATILSDKSDENINVCYVDYGNTGSCAKTSLKRCSKQLSLYPHQAKHCEFYGISSNEIDHAFKYLEENSDSEKLDMSIINEKDHILKVLVYIDNQCINEKFGYDPNLIENNDTSGETDDQSSITTATTVKEQEQSLSVAEKQISPDTSDIQKSETETKSDSSESRQGLLAHVEKSKPYVYLQLIPESESIIEQINQLIKTIIQEDKHNSSYNIGDHVIAQFSEDDEYYRARIESYSSSSELYTVYFLDYGNIDENVPIDRLYSYSDDLEKIEPQARGYLLDNISSETWDKIGRSLVEQKVNDVMEFDFIDEQNSTIHLKFDYTEETKTFSANISATDKDCFYVHLLPEDNLHVCEIEEILPTCNKDHKDTWSINDLCIVSNEENRYYRGEILAIDDEKYNVKCIDYGNILQNITNDHLYVVPDEEILKQSPLARQCRLYGIDDINQIKAIEDIIKNIPSAERVQINIEDRNDQCLYVTLARENHEIINDQYLSDNNHTMENENKEESDHEEKNIAEPIQSTTDNQVPQVENNNQENNSLLSITNNQTIDFGENDPSTTIKDETNNSISSN